MKRKAPAQQNPPRLLAIRRAKESILPEKPDTTRPPKPPYGYIRRNWNFIYFTIPRNPPSRLEEINARAQRRFCDILYYDFENTRAGHVAWRGRSVFLRIAAACGACAGRNPRTRRRPGAACVAAADGRGASPGAACVAAADRRGASPSAVSPRIRSCRLVWSSRTSSQAASPARRLRPSGLCPSR